MPAAHFQAHGWIAAEKARLFRLLTCPAALGWPFWLRDGATPGAEVTEQGCTSMVQWRLFLPGAPAVTLGRCMVGLLEGSGPSAPTLCMVRVDLAGGLRQRLCVADPGRALLFALQRLAGRPLLSN